MRAPRSLAVPYDCVRMLFVCDAYAETNLPYHNNTPAAVFRTRPSRPPPEVCQTAANPLTAATRPKTAADRAVHLQPQRQRKAAGNAGGGARQRRRRRGHRVTPRRRRGGAGGCVQREPAPALSPKECYAPVDVLSGFCFPPRRACIPLDVHSEPRSLGTSTCPDVNTRERVNRHCFTALELTGRQQEDTRGPPRSQGLGRKQARTRGGRGLRTNGGGAGRAKGLGAAARAPRSGPYVGSLGGRVQHGLWLVPLGFNRHAVIGRIRLIGAAMQ